VTSVAETVLDRIALSRHARYLPLAVLAVALAAGIGAVAWLVFPSGGEPASVRVAPGVPTIVSEAQLRQRADSVDHPVYWAGRRRGFRYELTTTTLGRIFVRYLPAGTAAGDPRPDFLTVGTYPGSRSFADLKRAANRQGAAWIGLEDGGLVVFAAKRATSAYLGYPGKRYQVEVFAPSNGTPQRLLLAGAVVPIH
jgi:hypothetical protein